jgi:hypothetical protein
VVFTKIKIDSRSRSRYRRPVTRYDLIYHKGHAYPEPHFCREWDETGGCYGTNPEHGIPFPEARTQIADFYQQLADSWRTIPEDNYDTLIPYGL